MKNKTASFLTVGVCLLGLVAGITACKTSQIITTDGFGNSVTNTVRAIDPVRVASVSKQAATVGTSEILSVHPEWLPQFQLAQSQLQQLAKSPTIGLQDILNIAQQLPVKELKSDYARISFEGATIFIAALDVPELPADKLATLQPIAQAIADGIAAGIASAPTPAPAAQ